MKKKVIISIMSAVLFLTACGTSDDKENKTVENKKIETEVQEKESEEKVNVEVETDEAKDDGEITVKLPREYKNALKEAQNYVDIMDFSEKELFDQLTSEYGGQYGEEAAQYAVTNVDVDYNQEALDAAMSYQELMPMSDQALIDQLTSEYGSQFTQEQAKYAIDNLPQ